MALRHVLLTLLSEQPATGYALTKSFEEVAGYFWQASHQQVYRELAAMQAEGLVEVREVMQSNRPDKKEYTLSATGLAELRRWLEQPTELRRSNDEGLVKLLGAHLLGREGVLKDLETQANAHRKKLATYRKLKAEFDDSVADKTLYERMAYVTLLKGIRVETARLQWTREAKQLIEQWL